MLALLGLHRGRQGGHDVVGPRQLGVLPGAELLRLHGGGPLRLELRGLAALRHLNTIIIILLLLHYYYYYYYYY